MKIAAPTTSHLARAYFELASHGARAIGAKKPWPYRPADLEELLVICAELSRYDPRLFDVIVELLYFRWRELNPLKLRFRLAVIPTPQAFLTALGFAASGARDAELNRMLTYVGQGFPPAPFQLFFRSLYAVAGSNMERAASEPIREFYEWGFLARERPVIHADGARKSLGSWGLPARRNVILRLIEKKGRLSMKDYLEALEHTISRQQALQDLKSVKGLTPSGSGRGSAWERQNQEIPWG
jgi:hypothetical protein